MNAPGARAGRRPTTGPRSRKVMFHADGDEEQSSAMVAKSLPECLLRDSPMELHGGDRAYATGALQFSRKFAAPVSAPRHLRATTKNPLGAVLRPPRNANRAGVRNNRFENTRSGNSTTYGQNAVVRRSTMTWARFPCAKMRTNE